MKHSNNSISLSWNPETIYKLNSYTLTEKGKQEDCSLKSRVRSLGFDESDSRVDIQSRANLVKEALEAHKQCHLQVESLEHSLFEVKEENMELREKLKLLEEKNK